MVLMKALGGLDIACAAVLAALAMGYGVPYVQAPLAFALACKGIIFSGTAASRIDIVCAIVMIALLWAPSTAIASIVAVYLGVKGLTSLA